MDKNISTKVENIRVYANGNDLVGTADVTLPDVEFITDTVKGAGVLGEIEVVSTQFKAMAVKLSFSSISEAVAKLRAPGEHELDLRGVVKDFDSATGEYKDTGRKYIIRGSHKKSTGGKLAPGEKMSNELEFTVTYYKEVIDGTVTAEIDLLNFKLIIDGIDHLAEQRKILGV